MSEQIERKIDTLHQEMTRRFEQIDKRFEQVEKRFEQFQEQMDRRFEQVDQRFEQNERMIQQLINMAATTNRYLEELREDVEELKLLDAKLKDQRLEHMQEQLDKLAADLTIDRRHVHERLTRTERDVVKIKAILTGEVV